jgi:A/G-specific adenine glycosylase
MDRKITGAPRSNKANGITRARVRELQKKIYSYYDVHGRDLPWRKRLNPYRVLVSEIMLQQTQVERVISKFPEFLEAYPDFNALSQAPLPRLLGIWQGMGYNRRALALKALAQKVIAEHHGRLPHEPEELLALPGIGPYTAGAIAAFAFNKPVVFMDTNIRRVYIHEFFYDRNSIHDDEILPLLEMTMDAEHPRKWYNALMDYGAMLKKELLNPNRRSAHYVRQSPFENSNRQVRGDILKALVAESTLSAAQIVKRTSGKPDRVKTNLQVLEEEGFIRKRGSRYSIA